MIINLDVIHFSVLYYEKCNRVKGFVGSIKRPSALETSAGNQPI